MRWKRANPEQSKHLETARMKILGSWVDLVNLRTETYSADSRIPEAAFGSAEQDALRRDFTINALFYNANTAAVEDMTGRGLDDLRAGIIRTPLSPMVTFQDDPLRVLRALRFASRFGFTLHEDLRAAAQDRKIQVALATKVSRERVGAELSGMLTGKMAQPGLALSLLQELGLAQAVYAPPENLTPPPPAGVYDWARGAAVARAAARVLAFRAGSEAQAEAKRLQGSAVCKEPPASTGEGKSRTPPSEIAVFSTVDSKSVNEGASDATKNGAVAGGGNSLVGDAQIDLQPTSSRTEMSDKVRDRVSASTVTGTAATAVSQTETTSCSDLPAPAAECQPASSTTATTAAVVPAPTGEDTVSDASTTAVLKGKGKAKAVTAKGRSVVEEVNGGTGSKTDTDDPRTLVRELFLSAALLPLKGMQQKIKKGKFIPAAQSVVQESLKLKSKEAKNVAEILEVLPTIRRFADILATGPEVAALPSKCEGAKGGEGDATEYAGLSRLDVGLAVRQVKELWPTCLDLCCAVEMCEFRDKKPKQAETAEGETVPVAGGTDGSDMHARRGGKRARDEREGSVDVCEENGDEEVMIKYARLRDAVRSMGLEMAWRIPPLIGGNDVINTLGVPKGPKIGELMNKQVHWQLEHRDGTREACLSHLKSVLEAESAA